MREYISKISPLMREFESFQLASGRWSESSSWNLSFFDKYCLNNYPEAENLTQEMVDSWCQQRNTESGHSCRVRTGSVVGLIHYLQKRGLTDVNFPVIPHLAARTYIPHAFTEDELYNFFRACDAIPDHAMFDRKLRRLTMPVFFRLLYSSGIRTNEARMLRRINVDLVHGVLDIQASKGHNQHFAVLHDSMLELMQQYNAAINQLLPYRHYFFPDKDDNYRSNEWVCSNFKKLWNQKNKSHAVAYDLRHNYAIENINSWTDDGFHFSQKLYSLSKSMGHANVESTKYYYSLVPRLADVLTEHTNEDETIPEVHYESY